MSKEGIFDLEDRLIEFASRCINETDGLISIFLTGIKAAKQNMNETS